MLGNEIQKRTALTRKAIEYYEKKGLIHPCKSQNGYRHYSEKDLSVLKKLFFLFKNEKGSCKTDEVPIHFTTSCFFIPSLPVLR